MHGVPYSVCSGAPREFGFTVEGSVAAGFCVGCMEHCRGEGAFSF